MGAGRPTQNIFHYLKRHQYMHNKRNWKQAWYLIKHFNKVTFGDSFGPMICKIIGHRLYQHKFFDPNVYACKTCNKYVSMPTPQEIDESLYNKEIETYALSPVKRFYKKLKKFL